MQIEVIYDDMTTVVVWHKPETDAPYVCIEPWHRIPADEGKTDYFASKHYMLTIKPEHGHGNTYALEISE